ncbi:carbohydrate ABC transporter permease [Microbacterium sp. 179-I 3D3 NHS]|uniref:carbohydrate ABC transporter permease n=1 Tax=unclassified Microbacterium TaxID=2609290 RepID=UPI00399FCD30
MSETRAIVTAGAPTGLRGEGGVRRGGVWALIFLTPFILVFGWFAVYPLVYELFIGLRIENYAALLENPRYLRTLTNTAVFVLVAVNLKMLLALALSSAMVSPSRMLRVVTIIALVPWMIPEVVALLSARWMFNTQSGLLNSLLAMLSLGPAPWLDRPEWALGAAIAMHIWKLTPFWALTILAARLAISRETYEAAALDGANRGQLFRFITWPRIAGVYFTGTVLATIWALGDFNSIYLITGGGPADTTQVLATLGVNYAFRQADPSLGASIVLTALPVLVIGVTYLIRRSAKKGVLL